MNFANSPGEFAAAGMTPSSMSRYLILGSPRAVLISLLSVAMMSGGMAAEADPAERLVALEHAVDGRHVRQGRKPRRQSTSAAIQQRAKK